MTFHKNGREDYVWEFLRDKEKKDTSIGKIVQKIGLSPGYLQTHWKILSNEPIEKITYLINKHKDFINSQKGLRSILSIAKCLVEYELDPLFSFEELVNSKIETKYYKKKGNS